MTELRSHLPHAKPSAALGDVTKNRHTVTRTFPAENDYGLGHFPKMERASVSDTFTPKNILTVHGLVQGRLDRAVLDDHWTADRLTFFTYIALLQETGEKIQAIESGKAGIDSSEVRNFWPAYIYGRWGGGTAEYTHLPEPAADLANRTDETLVKIREKLKELPDADPNEPDLMILRKAPSSNDVRFYLEGAATELRGSPEFGHLLSLFHPDSQAFQVGRFRMTLLQA